MPDRKNKAKDNEEVLESPKPSRAQAKKRQLQILITILVTLAILAISGAVYYQMKIAPFRRIVMTIDNHTIRMDYYLKRVRLGGGDQDTTLQQLTYELIVKIKAEELGIIIPESSINRFLRSSAAASANVTESMLTDAQYKEWYQNELKNTRMSDVEYRDRVRVNMMAQQLQRALVQNLPDRARQVHLHGIVVYSTAEAAQVQSRLAKGEPFSVVAAEMSVDPNAAVTGGDLGWIPQGLTDYDDVVFNLQIGQISDPVPSGTGHYMIFMVSEIDPERTITAAMKEQMGYSVFMYWVNAQMSEHNIKYLITDEMMAWVDWQVAE